MAEKRVNPKTGIVEERSTGLFGGSWAPAQNERGNTERVNPKSGVTEERWTAGGGLLSGWSPKANERGNQERVNKDTGVREERWSAGGGSIIGWDTKRDAQGSRERINKNTGLIETSWRAGGGLLTGWGAKRNENDRIERMRRDGRTEERHEILGGLVNVWEFKRKGVAAGRGGVRGGDTEPLDYPDTLPTAAPEEDAADTSGSSYTNSSSGGRLRLPDVGFVPWLFGYQMIAILILDNPLPRFISIFTSDSWLIVKVIEAVFLFIGGVIIYVGGLVLHPLIIVAAAASQPRAAIEILLIFGPTYPLLIWSFLSRR